MARQLIDYTEDAALRSTIPSTLSYSYIRELVQTHLGADAAAMLSEPQIVPHEGKRQWMAEAPISAPPIRLDRAPPEQAARALQILAEVRARARDTYENLTAGHSEAGRQQGLAILRAFELPNDDRYIWLLRDQPILVGWGHVQVTVKPPEPAELALSYRRPLIPPAPSETTTFSQNPGVSVPPTTVQHSYRWLAAFLWVVFVAVAASVGATLLPACSIAIPGTGWHWSWSAGCVARAQNPMGDLVAQNIALDNSLRTLQISLQEEDHCRSQNKLEAKVEAHGGDAHAPFQVTLEWHSRDDLDLIVHCPHGAISPLVIDRPRAGNCGDGVRDIDANYKMKENVMADPIEHTRWSKMPPGTYRVEVYPTSTSSSQQAIPYTVTLQINDSIQVCTGDVLWDGNNGYAESVIDFTPTSPAPSCNFREERLHVCKADEPCGK